MNNISYQIITDGVAELPQKWVDEHPEVTVVPTPIIYKGEVYEEKLSPRAFAELIDRGRKEGFRVTSSCPSPAVVIDAIKAALKKGLDVLYVAMTKDLSSTYNNINQAIKLEEQEPEFQELTQEHRVACVDSRCITAGLGILIQDTIARCKNIAQAIDYIECIGPKIAHTFTVTDFKQLKESGRIKPIHFVAATILGIKPIMGYPYVSEGHREGINVGKVRGTKRLVEAITADVCKNISSYTNRLIITCGVDLDHPDECKKIANQLKCSIQEKLPHLTIETEGWTIGPAVGSHVGPGTVGVFYEREALDLSEGYYQQIINNEAKCVL